MKAPFLAAVALVAVAFAGVAQAGAGPTSPLYLTYVNAGPNIVVIQGNSVINSFPEAYGYAPYEMPIAVYGDVRTTGYTSDIFGGQYTLSGTPTGTSYAVPSVIGSDGVYDSTSDGTHNYLVDSATGIVYQTARDFTNPTALFTAPGGRSAWGGITYDAANHSLWISGGDTTTVADYSLNGTLLSSFSTGHPANNALAFDPADHTLWLVNVDYTGDLEQYSTSGALLSTGPYVGFAEGGEFSEATPEPGTLIMFGSGILGLAGILRRKISL
jgi:hypothetical protein